MSQERRFSPSTPETQEQTEETETESLLETETETEPEIVYPAPDYDFTTEEVTVEIDGLTKEYTLAWVSDLHMITDSEIGDVTDEFMDTVKERYDTLSITEDGIHGEELWPEIVKYLNYNKFDGIIFGGDMMDYCSHSNMDVFLEGFKQIRDPVLYIRADHDYGAWYGGDVFTEQDARELHQKVDGDDLNEKYLDFGEFMVVGVNGSTKDMPGDQLSTIEDRFDTHKPIITATHVPYASKVDTSLAELSMQVRAKPYYWGEGIYLPNELTSIYLNMIYDENTTVQQVLAGHLHAKWDGMITEQVPQHIFSPAFQGVIGIIHVVPSK
ncbi:MAG: hypothetical protein PHP50_10990 [Lachnospiraceae bacterium]|nr:hypothetical protein [Lachnospiraceae bacterium]